MFCPECKAEYRQGFTACSDCHVALVSERPRSAQQERPDEETSQVRFLAWFAPMAVFYISCLLLMAFPVIARNPVFVLFEFILILTLQVGLLWMLYQVIRYEERPAKYLLLALIPFMFIWYWLGRYRTRQGHNRVPVALR